MPLLIRVGMMLGIPFYGLWIVLIQKTSRNCALPRSEPISSGAWPVRTKIAGMDAPRGPRSGRLWRGFGLSMVEVMRRDAAGGLCGPGRDLAAWLRDSRTDL